MTEVHHFRSSLDTGAADWLIDSLMRAARDDIEVSEISLPTTSYLMLAFSCGIDDPDAARRPVMRLESRGRSIDWATAEVSREKPPRPMVRVGAEFKIQGPAGPVTIREATT